jgi:hypothetical protein
MKIEMGLQELMDLSWETAEESGFHDPPLSYGEQVALMHSELSEMLEAHRKGLAVEDNEHGLPLLPELEELADLFIRIGDFCKGRNISGDDLAKAIIAKDEYNKTRPWRHGKKF